MSIRVYLDEAIDDAQRRKLRRVSRSLRADAVESRHHLAETRKKPSLWVRIVRRIATRTDQD